MAETLAILRRLTDTRGNSSSSAAKANVATSWALWEESDPLLVAWDSGTDEQIQDMIDGYYSGEISLDDIKSVWKIGDSRTIRAAAADGITEQDIKIVITDFDHDTLVTAKGTKSKALISWSQAAALVNADGEVQAGIMDGRRTWCNDVYYATLPDTFKSWVKQVKKSTYSNGTLKITSDYIWLPSEEEVYGTVTNAVGAEGSQYEYYEVAANRGKGPAAAGDISVAYWLRSPSSNGSGYCYVDVNGISKVATSNAKLAIVPHGSI